MFMYNRHSPLTDRNYSLDLLKGIGCVGVVFIHILFPGMFGRIVMKAAQFAVPVFFLTSGYYLYQKSERTIYRRLKRILKILIVSFGFYTLLTIMFKILSGSLMDWFKELPVSILKLIAIGNFDFVSAGHLYFLYIQILSYAVLLWGGRRDNITVMFKTLPALFGLRIIVYCVTQTLGLSWHIRSFFIWDALPWMLLGLYIAIYHEEIIEKLSLMKLLTLACVGTLFSVSFVIISFPIDISEIGVIISSTSLFLLVVMYPTTRSSGPVVSLGRIYSLYVYVIHLAVAQFYNTFLYALHIEQTQLLLWTKPIIILTISIAISAIFYKSKNCCIQLYKNPK